MPTKLDHVALGMPNIADAKPFLEGVLGGVDGGGFSGVPFGFSQWVFAGGSRIEVIYPVGPPDGFVHRFLARGGPRVHHVTFKVPSLDRACAQAEAFGYQLTGVDRSDPGWQQAFLHPKQAHGIVVQMVEHHPRGEGDSLPDPTPPPGAARVLGLRLRASDLDGVRRQWIELLGASESREGDSFVYRWPESPLALFVDVERGAEAGPVQIELSHRSALALPDGPVPELGARFVQRG